MEIEEIKKQLKGVIGEELTSIVNDVVTAKMDEQTKANKAEKAAASPPEAVAAMTGAVKTGGASDPRGFGVAQVVRAMAAGRGDVTRAAEWCHKTYGAEHSVTKMLSSDVHDSGGALVPLNTDSDVIELLRPASAIRQLNPVILPLPNGNLTMPGLKGGADASYIGEKRAIPASAQTTRSVRLTAKNLSALVPVTNDLIRYTGPQTDAVIRDDTIAALAQRSDLAFIRGNGGEFSPTGLRYLAADDNIVSANATVNLANVTEDLGKAVLALWNANTRMIRPGWAFAPRTAMYLMTVRDGNGNYAFRDEMMGGTLWGFPFRVTSQIPINLGTDESELYFADFADVMIAEADSLIVDISTEGVYTDEAGDVVSAFQNDLTLIRVIQKHDFNVRHRSSVAVLTGVKWGA